MDIRGRIATLEKEIEDMRMQWKDGSVAMKAHIEQKAKQKKAEIKVLESVLRRREHKKLEEEQSKLI